MIVLNEKTYVEEHYLKNNEMDEKPYVTLNMIAKYLCHVQGYKRQAIEDFLNAYMRKNYYLRYIASKLQWEDTIERIAKRAPKQKLYEDDCVWITKSELETIQGIGNRDMEQVIFTLLCLAKLRNQRNEKNNGWVNNDAKEIFELARVKRSVPDRDFMLHDLMVLGLLQFPKQTGNLANRVTFIDNESEKVLSITDYRELGYEYLKYLGENYVRCAECGRLIKGSKNNTRKYCNDCMPPVEDGMKIKYCVDCGEEFVVKMRSRTIRCPACYAEERKRIKRENDRKQYEKKKQKKYVS